MKTLLIITLLGLAACSSKENSAQSSAQTPRYTSPAPIVQPPPISPSTGPTTIPNTEPVPSTALGGQVITNEYLQNIVTFHSVVGFANGSEIAYWLQMGSSKLLIAGNMALLMDSNQNFEIHVGQLGNKWLSNIWVAHPNENYIQFGQFAKGIKTSETCISLIVEENFAPAAQLQLNPGESIQFCLP